MNDDNVILEMRGISKNFPGVHALEKVSFDLKRGEVHALIGENGAGKSTPMKILLGIHSRDEGTIIFKGKPVDFKSPHDALNAGISMIHQKISLVRSLSVAENIWLGHEKDFLKCGILDEKKRRNKTAELLKELELDINPSAAVKDLSVAQMQLVELARSVSYNSDVIIMDEPTSALTEDEIKKLFKIVRMVSGKGTAIIFISHKIDEIFSICSRVTVMRDGQYIDTKLCANLTQDELIAMIVGRQLSNLFPKEPAKIGEVVLEAEHLTSMGLFSDVSFKVHAGEIIGFSGLVGAGRTEIVSALFGILPLDKGTVRINGKAVKIKTPSDAIAAGMGMVTEDRRVSGSIHKLSVRENIVASVLPRLANKAGIMRGREEKGLCDDVVKRLSVKISGINQPMSQLSGGNQQKVIIGRWLIGDLKVLILDEPTRGIDVGSKAEIHHLISQLAQQGLAVILVSSEMPEILGMCDRIYVVRDGHMVFECSREDATQEILVQHAFGVRESEERK